MSPLIPAKQSKYAIFFYTLFSLSGTAFMLPIR